MIKHVTISEVERESGKSFRNIDDLIKHLKNEDPNDGTSTLSALGASYFIGDLEIPPLTAGIFPMMEVIESPFISANDDVRIQRKDFIIAIYVIVHGPSVLKPLMAIETRRNQLLKLEKSAKESPELYRVYLDVLDNVNSERGNFEQSAIDWFNRLGIDDFCKVESVVVSMFEDLYNVVEKTITDKSQKKNTDSTQNG